MSSSVMFLLMISRSRALPASGAKVSVVERTEETFSISSLVKLSARRDGSDRFIFLSSVHSRSVSVSSFMHE